MRRIHRFGLVVGLLAVVAGAGASGATADAKLATVTRAADLDAGQGLVVYSSYDPQAEQYRLMQIMDGVVSAVPVAPSPAPFDPDVGPTASGHAYLVYERCTKSTEGCDIYAYNPATGREVRSKASDPRHAEHHATYWQGRLAFVRDYGSAKHPRPIVYERPDPHSRRSERLPGLPAERCVLDRCRPVTGDVDALELHGARLAQIASSTEPVGVVVKGHLAGRIFDEPISELRLVDVDSGHSMQLAAKAKGLAGRTFVGASFVAGGLVSYVACTGEGCSATEGGADRYTLATGAWSRSGSSQRLAAFAADGDRTFELPVNAVGRCGPLNSTLPRTPCPILRRDPPPVYVSSKRP